MATPDALQDVTLDNMGGLAALLPAARALRWSRGG